MQHTEAKGNSSRFSLSRGRRPKSRTVYLLPFCFLFFGGGVVSCSNSAPLGLNGLNISQIIGNVTKISDIPKNQNAAATVYLQGQVANRAPFLAAGAYKLKDATGTIWVITTQTLPNVGDEVFIKGQLQFQSIPLGGQDLGEVYIQEQQQLERKAGAVDQPGQPEQPISPKESTKL